MNWICSSDRLPSASDKYESYLIRLSSYNYVTAMWTGDGFTYEEGDYIRDVDLKSTFYYSSLKDMEYEFNKF